MTPEAPEFPASDTRRGPVAFLLFVCIALSIATLAIYFQTHSFSYVTYDDYDYVAGNEWVKRGLTLDGFIRAFRELYFNWHPLTWLSFMLGVEWFGESAGPQHLINVALHLASTLVLFFALAHLTGKAARSALVAAVFAVHPLHVESVAWIAERKDVLSTFFAVLVLLLYASYARNRTREKYVAILVLFACSLMAKPMAVTLPFVLLLLDYWPLERLRWPLKRAEVGPLVLEKTPLFAMSVIVSTVTAIAQKSGGAVMSIAKAPLAGRVTNAFAASVWYMKKAFWPTGLAVFYPLEPTSAGNAIPSVLLVVAVTALSVCWIGRRPYVLVGWCWFLGMLLPVSGLVQVGLQGMADRYAYLPLTGLSIAVIWLGAEAAGSRPALRISLGAFACAILLVFSVMAHRQTTWWKDSETLYTRALAVTKKNYLAENNLGALLSTEGRHYEAIGHYEKSIAFRTDYAASRANFGAELLDQGRFDEAFIQLSESLRLAPGEAVTQANLGAVYRERGNYAEARRLLESSLRSMPQNPFAHGNLCLALAKTGHLKEAIDQCRESVRLKPDYAQARLNLAKYLAAEGEKEEAITQYLRLLDFYPSYPGVHDALEKLKLK